MIDLGSVHPESLQIYAGQVAEGFRLVEAKGKILPVSRSLQMASYGCSGEAVQASVVVQ